MSDVRRSSHPVMSLRVVTLIATMTVALILLPGTARAQGSEGCEDLIHVQTYSSDQGFFRAPAWHYGQNVTIVYNGQVCETTDASGAFVRDAKGEATIMGGSSRDGAEIERAPFRSTLRTNLGGHAANIWWSCAEGSLAYEWSISGIYDFKVVGQDGTWTVEQRDPAGNRPATIRSANACGSST